MCSTSLTWVPCEQGEGEKVGGGITGQVVGNGHSYKWYVRNDQVHTHTHKPDTHTHRPHLNFKKLPRCVYVIIFFPSPHPHCSALLGLPFHFCAFLPHSLLLLALNYTSACHYTHAHTHAHPHTHIVCLVRGQVAEWLRQKLNGKRPKRERENPMNLKAIAKRNWNWN